MVYYNRVVVGLKRVLVEDSNVVLGILEIRLTMDDQKRTGFWMDWKFLRCVTLSFFIPFFCEMNDWGWICGMILGFIFEDAVAFTEADVLEDDSFCLADTGDFGVFAWSTCRKNAPLIRSAMCFEMSSYLVSRCLRYIGVTIFCGFSCGLDLLWTTWWYWLYVGLFSPNCLV